MSRSLVETLLGAVVLAVAIGFLVFAYNKSGVATTGGYEVSAAFNRVDGITNGSDVRIGGIKVGTVVDRELEPETFRAVLRMSIDETVALPMGIRRPRSSATACSAASSSTSSRARRRPSSPPAAASHTHSPLSCWRS